MDMQPDITAFESQFNGSFPFASDGIIIGTPDASFDEEAAFRQWLPVRSGSCEARLSEFFTQWFDTAYASGGGANRPMITGPGLAGPGFYSASGKCG